MKTASVFLLLMPLISAQDITTSAQNATAFSLTYGYPLLAFHQFANLFLSVNVSNSLFNSPAFATPAYRTVVKPNVDTLYSAGLIDLSKTDLSLKVPELPSYQYALFSFYDCFGDNYANTGAGNFNKSGKYRIRAPTNETYEFGVRPAEDGSMSDYVADVMSPTNYGILLIRWGVNSSNIDAVHDLQSKTSLSTVNRTDVGNVPKITELGGYNISINTSMSPAEKTLELLAKYAPWNQPETEAGAQEVNPMLGAAGISNGMYSMPDGVDLEAANNSAVQTATTAAYAPGNNMVLNNGWSITEPGGLAGNFNNGTAYGYRTAIASAGFLQLRNPNAVYPSWANTSQPAGTGGLVGLGGYSLARDKAIVYTFSRKPPLTHLGFWSLTAYLNNYLIPNDLQRYAIGDRSNITYPDGTPIYGNNASSSNGPFQLLIQAADNPPPANWTSNWLPGPAGGGNISAILRWYGAAEDLLDGTYVYPVVKKQGAITSGGNATSGSNSTMPSIVSSSMAVESTMRIGQSSAVYAVMALVVLLLR